MNNSFAHHQKDHRPQPVSSREELAPSLSPCWPLQTQDSSSPFPIPTLSLALPMDWSCSLSIRKASLSVPDEVRMVSSLLGAVQDKEFIRLSLPGGSYLLNCLTCRDPAHSSLLCASFTEDSTGNKDSGQESECIPEYTAEEEREDNRLWRTVVIGEQEQRIDMKVIEPYRRVISHGGSGAQNQTRVLCSMTSLSMLMPLDSQHSGHCRTVCIIHMQFSEHWKAYYTKVTFQGERCLSYHIW